MCCTITQEWQNKQVGKDGERGLLMAADVRLVLEPTQSLPVHVPRCRVAFCPCFLYFPKLQRMEEKGSELLG